MKLSFAPLALLLAACSTTETLPDGGEYLAVANAAVAQVERGQTDVKYVFAPTVDRRARSAFAKIRTVIDHGAIPAENGVSLPRGYIVIERFELSAGEALVQGHGGPVIAGNRVSCGYYVTVPLKRVSGRWVAEEVPVIVC
jgi:hypothetical protein